MKRIILGLFVAVSFAAPAGAQTGTGGPEAAPPAGTETKYSTKTVYDFDDDLVEGDLIRPEGESIDTRKAAKHSSLIKIRADFIPEMLKAAEDM